MQTKYSLIFLTIAVLSGCVTSNFEGYVTKSSQIHSIVVVPNTNDISLLSKTIASFRDVFIKYDLDVKYSIDLYAPTGGLTEEEKFAKIDTSGQDAVMFVSLVSTQNANIPVQRNSYFNLLSNSGNQYSGTFTEYGTENALKYLTFRVSLYDIKTKELILDGQIDSEINYNAYGQSFANWDTITDSMSKSVIKFLEKNGITSRSATNSSGSSNFVGVNLGHLAALGGISSAIGYSYIPLHIEYGHVFEDGFGLDFLAMYRSEKVGNLDTQEFGFALGPAYYSDGLNGIYLDAKVGIAFAFGKNSYLEDYVRTDLVVQPDFGFFVNLEHVSFKIGLGVQSLIMLDEEPSRYRGGYNSGLGKWQYINNWDWNPLGNLAHYYLPVINLSIGLNF